MLRGLVVLFLGLNVALFFWIRSSPTWGQSEREPQRLQRQVSPASIQVLPDLPTGAAATGADTASPAVDGGFAPPAAGLPARPAASTAATGSAAAASGPFRRPASAIR